MGAPRKDIDWEKVRQEYRTGSNMSALARELGIRSSAISNRAKREDWTRDLVQPIRAAARAKVAAHLAKKQAAANALPGTTVSPVNDEPAIVDLNASVLAALDLAHRGDVEASRRLCKSMLDELGGTHDGAAAIRELMEISVDVWREHAMETAHSVRGAQQVEAQHKARLDAIDRVMSLPGRSSTLKQLVDSLEKLVKLERQISGLEDRKGETDGYEAVLKALKDVAKSSPEAFEGDVPGFLKPSEPGSVH